MLNADSILSATVLLRDGKPIAEALTAATAASDAELLTALASPASSAHAAALAILAGARTLAPAQAELLKLIGSDGVDGRAAAWALGKLNAESALISAVETGDLDVRENGYFALAVLAARGAASAQLAPAMSARVHAEIARAKQGGSGLGEKPLRVLAIIGAPEVDALIQNVIESDPYCDRFELQRLRKAASDGGRDRDSISELTAPWATVFADQLAPLPKVEPPKVEPPKAELKPAPAKPTTAKPSAAKPALFGAPPIAPDSTLPHDTPLAAATPAPDHDGTALDEDGLGDEPAPPPAQPVDWPGFAISPEAVALSPALRTMVAQLGPLLEKLAAQAIQAPLADLTAQEFAGLLLQVLPQALPPQHVQMALSPQALNSYQALAKFLDRTGAATHGDQLLQGVKLVRQALTEQMRASGMLGGPDYSDPDAAKPSA